MMTFAQWQVTRRVDHLTIGQYNPRFRRSGYNLKSFDADVLGYQNANNDFDRITFLGRIIQGAQPFLDLNAQNIPQRYRTAVQLLFQSASLEVNLVCGAVHQPLFLFTLHTIRKLHALLTKNVSLNIFYIAPIGTAPVLAPIDLIINSHITAANTSTGYQQAGLAFVRTNPVAIVATQTAQNNSLLLAAHAAVPAAQQGKFADGGVGGPRLRSYCNASKGSANSIDVVYVDAFDQQDVQGRTFRAGVAYNGVAAIRPIVIIRLTAVAGGAATHSTTLAHELGHALTSSPHHSSDTNNLMSSGNIRNGNNWLTDGQVAWFRNNPYT